MEIGEEDPDDLVTSAPIHPSLPPLRSVRPGFRQEISLDQCMSDILSVSIAFGAGGGSGRSPVLKTLLTTFTQPSLAAELRRFFDWHFFVPLLRSRD
jgi:hypothetical protein